MAEITIADKKVVLKDRFRGRDGYEITAVFGTLVDALKDYDAARNPTAGYDEYVALCKRVVESWEMDGDPTDAASYDSLEAFECWPLFARVLAQVSDSILPKKAPNEEPMDSG